MRSATSSAANLNAEEYDRKLSAFNHKRPWGTRLNQHRVSSWSDPVSAREVLDADESEESIAAEEGSIVSDRQHRPRSRTGSRLARGSVLGYEEEVLYDETSDAAGYLSDAAPLPLPRRRPATFALGRWTLYTLTSTIKLTIDLQTPQLAP
jgi:hypothetical protein